ncbi:MAG TPA: cysteine synthase A [bacterium]|nr:cysteine synthase A [bacterium]HPR89604.1 cysteine synthase A [bacterium]
MKAMNILATIGRTPHLRLARLFGEEKEVWIKLERANPGGSIKDRIALAMIEDAESHGLLTARSVIVEPTSGNTGIGLAMVAAVKGYPLILVMPESMSVERRRIMAAFGARLELTPREQGMRGAIEKARAMAAADPHIWIPMQFDNQANVEIHLKTTAREILEDFSEGLDYLITGVGTGGHITGVARLLKKHFPQLQVLAVEPELSPVLSGGQPGPHPLQGIGAGFVPAILDRTLLDGIVKVGKEEAFRYAALAARQEGLFAGISTGASLAAVAQKLPEMAAGSRVLTFCYDSGERYLSVDGLFE